MGWGWGWVDPVSLTPSRLGSEAPGKEREVPATRPPYPPEFRQRGRAARAPERPPVNAERTPKELDALSARLDSLREELSMFAGADEGDRVIARRAELEAALSNTFHQVSWHASDLLRNRDALGSLGIARWWHLRATTLVRVVLDLVRGRDVAERETGLRGLDKTKPG
jgi:hypothetical protein